MKQTPENIQDYRDWLDAWESENNQLLDEAQLSLPQDLHGTRKRRLDWLRWIGPVKCSKCGYDKCFGALEAHHRNPQKKTTNIAVLMQVLPFGPTGIEIMQGELSKCDWLCSNCHRELHEEIRRGTAR